MLAAPPEEVYAALTNPATIQLWSGEVAVMSTDPGSEFSLWEDSIVGRNLEFEEAARLRDEIKRLEGKDLEIGEELAT